MKHSNYYLALFSKNAEKKPYRLLESINFSMYEGKYPLAIMNRFYLELSGRFSNPFVLAPSMGSPSPLQKINEKQDYL
jgi:hypothetical protein